MPPRISAAGARAAGGNKKSDKDVDAKAAARKKAAQAAGKQKGMNESEKRLQALLEAQDIQEDDLVLEFTIPEWLELILAIFRISELVQWVNAEREERQKDTYQNPHQQLFLIVSSTKFETAMGILIFINCLLIGFEASVQDAVFANVLGIVEHFFIGVFMVEWCMRVRAFGSVWLFEFGNAVDTFLVWGTGVIPKWILQPIGLDPGPLRVLTVLRALRLVRIVRAVRTVPQLRELWIFVQGLLQSARPIMWTFVVGVFLLYIFAIMGTEFIGRQAVFLDDEYAQELFGSPTASMFTLVQLITLDTWAYTVARPIMGKSWWLVMYFVAYIMVAVFVFWNLITAVIVENSMNILGDDLQQKAKDSETQKKKEFKVLANIFLEIDEDGSGEISREEFEKAMTMPKVAELLTLMDLGPSDLEDLWQVLDDGDGSLTIKEFTNGIRRMRGPAKAKDIQELIRQMNLTTVQSADMHSQVRNFNHTLEGLESDIDRIQRDTEDCMGLFNEMFLRLQFHLNREEAESRLQSKIRKEQRELNKQRYGADTDEDEEPSDNDDESDASEV